jgi:hypothetical protein
MTKSQNQKLVLNQETKARIQHEQRYAKALSIAEADHIHQFKGESNRWLVQSRTDKSKWYTVQMDDEGLGVMSCTCPDCELRGSTCIHQIAVCIRYSKVV